MVLILFVYIRHDAIFHINLAIVMKMEITDKSDKRIRLITNSNETARTN